MEAVLGVSMTPSTVGLVLLEGSDADGATVSHDTIDIRGHALSLIDEICDQVVVAIRSAETVAAEHGRRIRAIGVTWSSGAGPQADALLRKLDGAGFVDVVPVRLPQATDALARRIAGIVAFDTTGVCVLEPDVVQAMTVDGRNPVRTTVSRGIETVAGLIEWMQATFDAARPRPNALVVVGSAVDLDSVLPKLERALAVPVFTPAEPGLPLARGAALASVRRSRETFIDDGAAQRGWRRPGARVSPLAILVGGVAAFAISLCLAIGQQLIPGSQPTPHRTTHPVVSTSGDAVNVREAPAAVIPTRTSSTSEVPVEPEPIVQPDYVDATTATTLPDDDGYPSESVMPSVTGPEPTPLESQPPPTEPGQAAFPPESPHPPVPADPGQPVPPPETVAPPAPEALPVPPPPAEPAPAPTDQVPVTPGDQVPAAPGAVPPTPAETAPPPPVAP